MSGAVSGYKSIGLQEAPLALYFHCAAHRLNLAVGSACKIQAFKNAESYVEEIASFFFNTQQRDKRPWIKPLKSVPLEQKQGSGKMPAGHGGFIELILMFCSWSSFLLSMPF